MSQWKLFIVLMLYMTFLNLEIFFTLFSWQKPYSLLPTEFVIHFCSQIKFKCTFKTNKWLVLANHNFEEGKF